MPSSPASNAAGGLSDLVMPKLGLTMTEGLLAEWRVAPGTRVRAGEVIFVVETDKIANEVEAPSEGEIVEILVEDGRTVPVGTPLARWTGHGQTEAAAAEDTPALTPSAGPGPAAPGRVKATPLARRLARERGVELAALTGSGPGGRIKAADVEAFHAPPPRPAPQPAPQTAPAARGEAPPLSAKHQAMVRRVVAAKREIPHFYLMRRAEVSALLSLRAAVNAAGGPKATLSHFIVKAVGRALRALPQANRIWADGTLLPLADSDVGLVVDTAEGLFIPILRRVAETPFDRLCATAAALTERARGGGLAREDLEGGAVSVSNLGMAGVESVTPIISPPQAAILGVGAVTELFRPDEAGRPALRRELSLTLACDHRVFDGMTGARFLEAIARGLESPHSLFLTGQD